MLGFAGNSPDAGNRIEGILGSSSTNATGKQSLLYKLLPTGLIKSRDIQVGGSEEGIIMGLILRGVIRGKGRAEIEVKRR